MGSGNRDAVDDWLFEVSASPSPQLPCRILGLFAQQDLLPSAVEMSCSPRALDLRATMPAVAAGRAEILAAKIGSIIGVRTIRLTAVKRATATMRHLSQPRVCDGGEAGADF